jgi:hypothetical protein
MGSLSIWHWLIVFFFFPLMIVLIASLIGMARGSGLRGCPFCAEFVRPEAIVCKHCGRDIQAKKS